MKGPGLFAFDTDSLSLLRTSLDRIWEILSEAESEVVKRKT
jgi:hypothetical protein